MFVVMDAMALTGTAKQTLRVIEDGQYLSRTGELVSIRAETDRALNGTILYTPRDVEALPLPRAEGRARLEVTGETTATAARRLCEEGARVVLLNFASARNPGGGFLGGAKAQEEDLARCSALYSCLVTKPGYYEANRAQRSLLYTDHLIYSPDVPFFRDERHGFLEKPFFPSVITSPAPNAGGVIARETNGRAAVHEALIRRARHVLAVAAKHGHRTLVLGAWGCGVFRNDPAEVAEVFATLLEESGGTFERVVFAVWERSGDGPNLQAFRARFTGER